MRPASSPSRCGVRHILLACVVTLGVAAGAVAQTIKLAGTGAALGTMQRLADALQRSEPTFVIQVMPNLGSVGAVRAIAAGALDLALLVRPLASDEAARGLVGYEYGRTPIVFVTRQPNVTSITIEQVGQILTGKQPQWPDGTPIRVVLRPGSSADAKVLAAHSPVIAEALKIAQRREGMIVAINAHQNVTHLERLPGSFGTTTLAQILTERPELTVLRVDGVAPTVAEAAAGRYPYVKPLYIVARANASAAVQRFLDFIRSPEGAAILAATGHLAGAPNAR